MHKLCSEPLRTIACCPTDEQLVVTAGHSEYVYLLDIDPVAGVSVVAAEETWPRPLCRFKFEISWCVGRAGQSSSNLSC